MNSAEYQKLMSRLIPYFTAAVQNAGIYPDNHPQSISYMQETHRVLEEMFEAKKEITILLIGDSLMSDNRPLNVTASCEGAFAQILRNNAIERISFIKGLVFAEFKEFIKSLSSGAVSSMSSMRHVGFGKLRIREHEDLNTDLDALYAVETDAFHEVANTAEDKIKNIYRDTSGGKINLDDTNDIVRLFRDNLQKESNPLHLLAITKSNDEYTFTHTANVGILTLYFAEHLGFKGSYLNDIGVAAILHDVGKVTTPDSVLSKPGPLTPDERAVMEMHAMKGALSLIEQVNIANIAVLTAFEHHMKYDGTGYPRVKGKWEQNIVSQMISVADVYDALRTMRPYRQEVMPMERVIQIFKNGSGTDFNPYLVERFLNLISK
ncbi:MAG: HD domain-containing protein [Desulfobacteraceae bacterium]|nr:MAG: HD domain-containing protein [Desulfobacteraceae bacterium]